MSHDRHEGQPGFSPDQVLVDDCRECSFRSENIATAVSYLDTAAFAKAWHRATQHGRGELRDASHAEVPLLRALFVIQVQFERRGVPLGTLPVGSLLDVLGAEVPS